MCRSGSRPSSASSTIIDPCGCTARPESCAAAARWAAPPPAHCLVIATGNSCALLIKDQTVRLKPGAAVVLDGSCDFDLVLEKESGRSCLLDWLHITQGAEALFPAWRPSR